MKASVLLAMTGLSPQELSALLGEIGVSVNWQTIRSQQSAFKDGKACDDLLNNAQASSLLALLDNPIGDIQQKASRLFKEVTPYFRGVKVEKATPFGSAPMAKPIMGEDWVSQLFSKDSSPVTYDRSQLESDNAGVTLLDV